MKRKRKLIWHHIYCVFTYIYSLLIEKDIMFVKTFQLSLRVFMCAFHPEISSLFGKSFLFSYFCLLKVFPFNPSLLYLKIWLSCKHFVIFSWKLMDLPFYFSCKYFLCSCCIGKFGSLPVDFSPWISLSCTR